MGAPFNQWAGRSRILVRGVAGLNEPAFETENGINVDEGPGRTETTSVTVCASSLHAIRKLEEIGGVCNVCRGVLCVRCAEHTCGLCGACVCWHHSEITRHGDVCTSHSFVSKLLFHWVGRPR